MSIALEDTVTNAENIVPIHEMILEDRRIALKR